MTDDDDIRALLAGADAEEGPPLRLDPAAIVRDGGRIRRRRRYLQWAGSSFAVVLVLVAVVVTVAALQRGPGRVGPGQPAAPPAQTTTAVLPVPGAPSAVPRPTGSPAPQTTSPDVPASTRVAPTSTRPPGPSVPVATSLPATPSN